MIEQLGFERILAPVNFWRLHLFGTTLSTACLALGAEFG